MAEQAQIQVQNQTKYIRVPRREEKWVKIYPIAFKIEDKISCRSPVTSDRYWVYYLAEYIDGIVLLIEMGFTNTRNVELVYCVEEKLHMCNILASLARALWLSYHGVSEVTSAIHYLFDDTLQTR